MEHGENYKQETNSNVQFLMHFQPQLCDLNAILCFWPVLKEILHIAPVEQGENWLQ